MTAKPKDDYAAMLERIQREADQEEENKLNKLKEKQVPISKPVAPPISFVSSNSLVAARTTPTHDKPASAMISSSSIPD